MNVELLTEMQHAHDVGDVVKVLARHAKPFGEIRSWNFTRDREQRLLRVFISLENTAAHEELSRRLGGRLLEKEVVFDIPLPIPLESTETTLPPFASQNPTAKARR
jgi:hypothetical protein